MNGRQQSIVRQTAAKTQGVCLPMQGHVKRPNANSNQSLFFDVIEFCR